MKFLSRLLILILINAAALYAAGRLIPGFSIRLEIPELLLAASLLTLINLTIKPFLKLVFLPLIFLTFGLTGFFINALTLYSLAYLSNIVIIEGPIPLLLSTLLIGIINAVCQRLMLSR